MAIAVRMLSVLLLTWAAGAWLFIVPLLHHDNAREHDHDNAREHDATRGYAEEHFPRHPPRRLSDTPLSHTAGTFDDTPPYWDHSSTIRHSANKPALSPPRPDSTEALLPLLLVVGVLLLVVFAARSGLVRPPTRRDGDASSTQHPHNATRTGTGTSSTPPAVTLKACDQGQGQDLAASPAADIAADHPYYSEIDDARRAFVAHAATRATAATSTSNHAHLGLASHAPGLASHALGLISHAPGGPCSSRDALRLKASLYVASEREARERARHRSHEPCRWRLQPSCFGLGGEHDMAALYEWGVAQRALSQLETCHGYAIQMPPLGYTENVARRAAEAHACDWFFSTDDFDRALLGGTLELRAVVGEATLAIELDPSRAVDYSDGGKPPLVKKQSPSSVMEVM